MKIKRFIVHSFIIGSISILLLEVSLRVLRYFLPPKLAIILDEAGKIPKSNNRVAGAKHNRVSIVLPKKTPKDLLFVGDSFTFGTYVEAKDRFSEQLARLSKRQGVNLGISGQSPLTYNRMVEVGMRYQPKVIYYCVFGNDFLYKHDYEVRELDIHSSELNRFGDEKLFSRRLTWTNHLVRGVRLATNQSLFFQLYKLLNARAKPTGAPVLWKDAHYSFVFLSRSHWDLFLDYEDPNIQAGVRLNKRLIQEASRFSDVHGVRFVVVFFPTKEMVYGPLLPIKDSVFSSAHQRTYEALIEALQRRGITTVNLTEGFRDLASKGEKLYHSLDGHLNELGHLRTAQILQWHEDRRIERQPPFLSEIWKRDEPVVANSQEVPSQSL